MTMSRVADVEFSVPVSFSPVDQYLDIARGAEAEGIGLLDVTTAPLTRRATGELASEPTRAGITAAHAEARSACTVTDARSW